MAELGVCALDAELREEAARDVDGEPGLEHAVAVAAQLTAIAKEGIDSTVPAGGDATMQGAWRWCVWWHAGSLASRLVCACTHEMCPMH